MSILFCVLARTYGHPLADRERYFQNAPPQGLETCSYLQRRKTLAKSQMEEAIENGNGTTPEDQINDPNPNPNPTPPTLSKNARKKVLKLQKYEAKKAERKAFAKEKKQKHVEKKRQEWAEKLASVSEEEKSKLIESRKELRKERMGKRSEERGKKMERLRKAREMGQKIIIDLEFSDLMNPNEISSLVQQIMYCYAVNGRCTSPGHLWLTGCRGEIEAQLQKLPGFDKWFIEKESQSYIEALQDQKENLVYLTADAETVLDELDPKKIYVVGGLVDRNRWKGITMKKAQDQGIQSAKLPIASYLKMSSSQVLTVNQVVEILLKFLETRNWKSSFFQVVPQRKRCDAEEQEDGERKKKCIEEEPSNG
ncbi:tRNA (guanine(9)-N1)-methyltransferase-like protein [Tasmannia lanceolata]|uniref:tRNA (guanine(9)-N1)-methyltransferase-like protein n=1 Tax=Tasmannia lanceolata TaxID=3420 RepID=UPI0040643161